MPDRVGSQTILHYSFEDPSCHFLVLFLLLPIVHVFIFVSFLLDSFVAPEKPKIIPNPNLPFFLFETFSLFLDSMVHHNRPFRSSSIHYTGYFVSFFNLTVKFVGNFLKYFVTDSHPFVFSF